VWVSMCGCVEVHVMARIYCGVVDHSDIVATFRVSGPEPGTRDLVYARP